MIKNKIYIHLITFFFCFPTFSSNFNNVFQLQSSIYFGVQSKTTNLYWFATSTGISSFDGQNFKNYESQNSFYGLECFKLAEDDLGRIWFYSNNGNIGFYNGYKFEKIEFAYEISNFITNGVIVDLSCHKEEILLLMHHNIIRDSFFMINIKFTNLIKYKVKSTILKFSKISNYWIAKYGNDPVVIMNADKSERFSQVHGTKKIFYSNKKIITFDSNKINLLFNRKGVEINSVHFQNDNYLIAMSSGCIIYDKNMMKQLSKHIVENVSFGFYDNEENIILTTLNKRLLIIPKYSIKFIPIKYPRDFIKIKSDGTNLYLSDISYNLWVYSHKKESSKLIFKNKEKSYVDANIFLNKGYIYFNKYKFSSQKTKSYDIRKIDFVPLQLYRLANFKNLISTGYADVKVMDEIDGKRRMDPIFYGKKVYDSKIDSNGVLWVATIAGLYRGKIDFENQWRIKKFELFFKGEIVENIQFYRNIVFVLVNKRYIKMINNNQCKILNSPVLKNIIINKYLFLGEKSMVLSTNAGLYYMEFQFKNDEFNVCKSAFIAGFKNEFLNEINGFDTLKNWIYFISKNMLFKIDLRYCENIGNHGKCYFESVFTGKRVFDITDLRNNRKINLENNEKYN